MGFFMFLFWSGRFNCPYIFILVGQVQLPLYFYFCRAGSTALIALYAQKPRPLQTSPRDDAIITNH